MGDDVQYATSDDLSVIVRLIEAHRDAGSFGDPAFVEPEPEMVKGFLGRPKEGRVHHSFGISLADPAAHALEAMVTAPVDPAPLFQSGELPLCPGWQLDPALPNRLFTTGPPDAALTARWIVDTLLALGAPLPTGRWRCYSPSMPGWSQG